MTDCLILLAVCFGDFLVPSAARVVLWIASSGLSLVGYLFELAVNAAYLLTGTLGTLTRALVGRTSTAGSDSERHLDTRQERHPLGSHDQSNLRPRRLPRREEQSRLQSRSSSHPDDGTHYSGLSESRSPEGRDASNGLLMTSRLFTHTDGVVCPVCSSSLSLLRVQCPACAISHHRDCWQYNGGCGIYGCPSRRR